MGWVFSSFLIGYTIFQVPGGQLGERFGGNLGGVVCTPLIPWIAGYLGWVNALLTGSIVALASAGLWLLVRPDEPVDVD